MPVFDDVFGMMSLCTENFRGGVRDSFGASIITDVLEPILMEIDSFRSFNEEFKHMHSTLIKFWKKLAQFS